MPTLSFIVCSPWCGWLPPVPASCGCFWTASCPTAAGWSPGSWLQRWSRRSSPRGHKGRGLWRRNWNSGLFNINIMNCIMITRCPNWMRGPSHVDIKNNGAMLPMKRHSLSLTQFSSQLSTSLQLCKYGKVRAGFLLNDVHNEHKNFLMGHSAYSWKKSGYIKSY